MILRCTASVQLCGQAAHSLVTQCAFPPKIRRVFTGNRSKLTRFLSFNIPNPLESLDVGTSTDDKIEKFPGYLRKCHHELITPKMFSTLLWHLMIKTVATKIFHHFSGRGSHAEFRIIFGDLFKLKGCVLPRHQLKRT